VCVCVCACACACVCVYTGEYASRLTRAEAHRYVLVYDVME
jgi:hypothetical protein